MKPACPCGYDDGGSHYHCANCGGVSGMYGHYNPREKHFICPEFPHGVIGEDELNNFIDQLNNYENERGESEQSSGSFGITVLD